MTTLIIFQGKVSAKFSLLNVPVHEMGPLYLQIPIKFCIIPVKLFSGHLHKVILIRKKSPKDLSSPYILRKTACEEEKWEISCLINNFAQCLLNLHRHELPLDSTTKSSSSLPSRTVLNCTVNEFSFFSAFGDHVHKQCDFSKYPSSLKMPHFGKQNWSLLFKLYPRCTWSDNSERSYNCTVSLPWL